MTPSFPLPSPWVHVGYRDLAGALDQIDARCTRAHERPVHSLSRIDSPPGCTGRGSRPGASTRRAVLRDRYRRAPARRRTRWSHRTHAIQRPRPGNSDPFRRDQVLRSRRRPWRHRHLLAPARRPARHRWQFQENQLRFCITVEDPDLRGKAKRAAREAIVQADHAGFFDHFDVEAILGSDLRAKSCAPGKWLGFNPDFVYRHRPVKPAVSTARLAQALASMTRRVDDFADKAGYDPG